jgi:5-methylcytosine-specific restriction endonuclease McrA
VSGREEFDWGRMRREEDNYFAVKRAEPKPIKAVLLQVMREARKNEHRPDEVDEELARLQKLPYRQYLKTPHWLATRERIKKRDGFQCRDCASKKRLNVHHETYLSPRGMERDEELLTLCRKCHVARHRKRIPGRRK